MSKEISRTFDLSAGQVIVTIEDDLGTRSVHTIHLLDPDGSEADIKAIVEKLLKEAKERAVKLQQIASKHGWKP
jgi:hypothetical protein